MTVKAATWFALCMLTPSAVRAEAPTGSRSPLAIPTFHCLGLYWSPPGGSADKQVQVRYRRQGAAAVEGGPADALQPHPRAPTKT